MVSELALLPGGRTLRRWDLAAAVYMLVSPAVGAVVGWLIWPLADLQVHTPAVVVGVAVALLPTVPLVTVCLPLRGARAREVAGLKRKPARPAEPKRVGLRPPAGWVDTGAGSEPDRG